MPDEPTPHPEIKAATMPAPSGPMPHLKGKVGIALLCVGLLGLLYLNRPKGPQGPIEAPPQLTPAPAPRITADGLNTPPPPKPSSQTTPAEGTQAPPQLTPEEQRHQQLLDQRQQLEAKAAFETNVIAKETRDAQTAPKQPQSETIPPSGETTAAPKEAAHKALDFDPSRPLYTLPEGTVIEAALDSKLEGEFGGPVDAHVTTPVYAPGTRTILIPQGAKLMGEAGRVAAQGQQRLAVVFHRVLIYPSITSAQGTYSIPLDSRTPGLGQQGENGLTGKVNNHILSTLGISAAIGLISGLSSIGSYGGGYSPATGFYNGVSTSVAENSGRALDHFLNRLPSVTVQPGTRVKVRLIQDVEIPALEGAKGE